MGQFFENLIGNPLFTLAIVLLGIAVSLYFGLKARQIKRFSYDLHTTRLIETGNGFIPQLKCLFDGKEVQNVTVSKCTLWNSGNLVINNADIVEDCPISFSCENGATILDAQVIRSNENSNHFAISPPDGTKATVSFSYVDKNEGTVIQIIHTGKDITIDGKIKGGKQMKRCNNRIVSLMPKLSVKSQKVFILTTFGFETVMVMAMGVFELLKALGVYVPTEKMQIAASTYSNHIMASGFLLFFAFTMLFVWIWGVRKLFLLGIPSGLRSIDNQSENTKIEE